MSEGAHIQVTSSGIDEIADKFDKTTKRVNQMGKRSQRVAAMMTRNLRGVSSQFRAITTAVTGYLSVTKGKEILDFNDQLGILQGKMKANTTEMLGLRNQMMNLSTQFGLTKENVLGAVQTFQDFGGVVKQGREDLPFLSRMAKATGSSMAELARLDSILIGQGMEKYERWEALAKLNAQADAANVSLQDLSRVMPNVLAGGAALNLQGMEAIEQLGPLLQVAGEVVGGSAEEARTSLKRLSMDLIRAESNVNKVFGARRVRKAIGTKKFRAFDEEGKIRDIPTVMAELLKITGGKLTGKRGIISARIMSAFSAGIIGKFKEQFDFATGTWKKGSKVAKLATATKGATVKSIGEQYERATQGIAKTGAKVSRSLATLDAAIQKYGTNLINFLAQDWKKTLLVGAGGYAGIKTLPGIGKWLLSRHAAKGKGSTSPGDILGVQKVFVVNMPGAGLGGAATTAGSAAATGGASAVVKTGLVTLGTSIAAGVVSAYYGGSGGGFMKSAMKKQGERDAYNQAMLETNRLLSQLLNAVNKNKKKAGSGRWKEIESGGF